MIVRDEEAMLPGCLAGAAGLVDEIVVVDTGSADGTPALAGAHGARVFHFPWVDDFAAARNESLRHATGEWILYLDADERLECGQNGDCLRRAAAAPGVDAYSVPILSRRTGPSGEEFTSARNIRMFRNLPGVRFSGPVHERVEPFLVKNGAAFGDAPFRILHLGYDQEPADTERKRLRNLRLMHKHLALHPDEGYTLYYMGLTLLELNRIEQALEPLARALRDPGVSPPQRAMTLNLLGYCYLRRGGPSSAAKWATESLRLVSRQNTAHIVLGCALHALGEYTSALPHLERALRYSKLPPEERESFLNQEHGVSGSALLSRIADCYAEAGDHQRATDTLEALLSEGGESSDTLLRLGMSSLNAGDDRAALGYLQRAEAAGALGDGLELALSYALARLGEIEKAMDRFERIGADFDSGQLQRAVGVLTALAAECGPERLASTLERRRDWLHRVPPGSLAPLASALAAPGREEPLSRFLKILLPRGAETAPVLELLAQRFDSEGRRPELSALLEGAAGGCADPDGAFQVLIAFLLHRGDREEARELYSRHLAES
jgi:tetratricopeptide (TPR) repeat protein